MKATRFKEIDALRGIAAVMVVIYHLTVEAKNAGFIFAIGCSGVDLFFIISGFVIFLTLKKTVNWKDFVVSRFSRLFPAYWFCVTFTTCAILLLAHYGIPMWDKKITIVRYFANMSMVQYYFNIHNIDGTYWTLVIELVFYFLMLVLFLFKQLKNIEIIGISIILLLVPYSFNISVINHSFFHIILVALPIINFAPLFFSGILFYKLKFEKQTTLRYAMIITCLIVQLLLYKVYMNKDEISFNEYIVMLIIYYASFILYVNDLLSFIITKATLFLGEISYSMYLIHQFIGTYILVPFAIKYLHINFWVAAFGIALPVIILLATFINKLIEKPGMRFIRNLYTSETL